MSTASKIASNTIWQILGKIIGTLASGLALILLTRQLSQTDFGYYGTALSLTQFAAVLCDLGLYVVCLREISSQPEKEEKIFSNFLSLRIISAFVILGISTFVIFLLPYPAVVKQTSLLFAFGFLFSSIVQLLTTFFQKRLTMELVAVAETIGRIAMLVIIYLLLKINIALPWLAVASIFASGISLIWLFITIKKQLKISLSVNIFEWKQILKKTWPVTLGVLLNLVYFRADSIILSLVKPAIDVAIYTAPYKLLEIIVTFPHMFMGLIMPLTAIAWLNKDFTKLNSLTQKTSEFFLMLTIPLLASSFVVGDKIMTLVAGKEYSISGTILFPLMIATMAIFAGTAFTYLAVTIEKQKAMLPYYAVASVSAILLYIWLIPVYSYIAAAWITAIIEIFIALSGYMITKKTAQLSIKITPLLKIIFSGVIMLVLLYLSQNLNIILQLTLTSLVYLIMLVLFKSITTDDLKMFFKLKNNS